MRKTLLITLSALLLLSHASVVLAQDAPNLNITKRRPDRPSTYLPTTAAKPPIPAAQPEVKQIQTNKPSFLSELWARIKTFSAGIFKLPTASSTTANP